MKSRTFLTGKFVTKLTSRLGTQFGRTLAKIPDRPCNHLTETLLSQWDVGAFTAFKNLNTPVLETWKWWLPFHTVRRCHWSWRESFWTGQRPWRAPDTQYKRWGGEGGGAGGVLTQELPFHRNACTAGNKCLYLIVHPWECISGSTPANLLQSWDTHRHQQHPSAVSVLHQAGADHRAGSNEAMARSSSQQGQAVFLVPSGRGNRVRSVTKAWLRLAAPQPGTWGVCRVNQQILLPWRGSGCCSHFTGCL